jgi:hypothetical protein
MPLKMIPLPDTEKVLGEKEDKSYKALFLENSCLKIMVLPELGAAFSWLMKTKAYHFINITG